MTPSELRELAEALAKGTHFVDSPELHAAMQNAADYLRACADEKPVEGAVYEDGGVSLIRRGTERERCNRRGVQLLYLHPAPAAPQAEPKREPLSDDEISKLAWKQNVWTDGMIEFSILAFAREIENAHGIGGSDE